MWVVIKTYCENNHGKNRTLEPIQSKWKYISRKFQRYIVARALVTTKIPSGRTIEEAVYKFMHLYCKRGGRKNSIDKMRSAPPFTYQETDVLSQQPKWEEMMTGKKGKDDGSEDMVVPLTVTETGNCLETPGDIATALDLWAIPRRLT